MRTYIIAGVFVTVCVFAYLGLSRLDGVRTGKSFRFDLTEADEASALAQATEVADRLLANPVIEESTVVVVPATGA